jgi:hypothetical protein
MAMVVSVRTANFATVSFTYPRPLFALHFAPIISTLPKVSRPISKRKQGDYDNEWNWTINIETGDLDLLNTAFFDQFHCRVYCDAYGDFNFDPAVGPLRGGLVSPIIDKFRLAVVIYKWHLQECSIKFFMKKFKCETFEENSYCFGELAS